MKRWFALSVGGFVLASCAPLIVDRDSAARLPLLSEAFSRIETDYVDPPDFSLLRRWALAELEEAVRSEAFLVLETQKELKLNYKLPGASAAWKTFSPRPTRLETVQDIEFAHSIAIQIVPTIESRKLEMAMLKKAVVRLDRRSSFLNPESYRGLKTEATPGTGGIGVELAIRDGQLAVIAPIEGATAHRAGILPGDRIVKIDGASTSGMDLLDAVGMMRGGVGTKVTITILRAEWPESKNFELTREVVRVRSVYAGELDAGIGFLRIRQFQEQTPRDVEAALQELERQGLQALILDLRNNSGGLLIAALEVAEKFLEKGVLITYTEGRAKNQTLRFPASAEKPRLHIPMVIVVNNGTAAGAEVVAGALQESGRGPLLGSQTFGHSSLQTFIPLLDGSALKLTTARWFTPKGRSVEGMGLEPEVLVEAPPLGSGTVPGDLTRDVQLQRALELARTTKRL